MKPKTAAKWMLVLMSLVVLIWFGLSQYKNSLKKRPKRRLRVLRSTQQRELLIQEIKLFVEHEGVLPRTASELWSYRTVNFPDRESWVLQTENKTILLSNSPRVHQRNVSARITFKPKRMIVELGQELYSPNIGAERVQFESAREYKLHPADKQVSHRAFNRLKARLELGDLEECREAVTWVLRVRGTRAANRFASRMAARFPKSRWAKLAGAYMALEQKRNPSDAVFLFLLKKDKNVYAEWFHAKRLYSTKKKFYEFAKRHLPAVPEEVRDRCFEHAVQVAYGAKDFQTAIQFCQQWDSVAATQYYTASLLASHAPKKARILFEKKFGPIDRYPQTSLKKAILNEDVGFTLPQSLIDVKPFFPKLSDFAVFPDLK